MIEWWQSLDIAQQVFYCIAIPATLIIVIQTILLMLGMGNGGSGVEVSDTGGLDLDGTDISGDISDIAADDAGVDIGTGDGSAPSDFGAMQLFTLQGIMTFLCVLGWTGVICSGLGLHAAIGAAIGLVLGFLAMLGVAKVLQLSKKLTQSGNIDMKKLLGKTAGVYIPIPAGGSGHGKVTVSTGERYTELDAVTDEDGTIPTGTQVRIIDIRGDVVVVEKDN